MTRVFQTKVLSDFPYYCVLLPAVQPILVIVAGKEVSVVEDFSFSQTEEPRKDNGHPGTR